MNNKIFLASFDNRVRLPSHVLDFWRCLPAHLELNFLWDIDIEVNKPRIRRARKKAASINEKVNINLLGDNFYYKKCTALFDSLFVNYSTGGYDFEQSCFHRWFALNSATNHLDDSDHICLLDTDFVLGIDPGNLLEVCLSNTTYEELHFISTFGGAMGAVSPELTIIKKSALRDFCKYLVTVYFAEPNISRLVGRYFEEIGSGMPGGVCDMTALVEWLKTTKQSYNIYSLRDLPNMSIINNLNSFCSERRELSSEWRIDFNCHERINLIENNEKLRLLGVHFQGSAKDLFYLIRQDNNGLKSFALDSNMVDTFVNSQANKIGIKKSIRMICLSWLNKCFQ